MKLDSEEQRKELLDLISQVPITARDEAGRLIPFTVGLVAKGVPQPIEALIRTIGAAAIEEPTDSKDEATG